jgi:hypothetical protein
VLRRKAVSLQAAGVKRAAPSKESSPVDMGGLLVMNEL